MESVQITQTNCDTMRTLILLFFIPVVAFATSPNDIDLSYSMKGENIIMTWTAQPEVVKYIVEAGDDVNSAGEIVFSKLFEANSWSNSQVSYKDNRVKPEAIIYYKVYGLNNSGEIICKTEFTANFTSKNKYTLNISPNFFSEILEVEINTKKSGSASISVESIDGTYKNSIDKKVSEGYNNFIININDSNASRLIVKVDHDNKIQYRMIEMEGTSPAIITSDE